MSVTEAWTPAVRPSAAGNARLDGALPRWADRLWPAETPQTERPASETPACETPPAVGDPWPLTPWPDERHEHGDPDEYTVPVAVVPLPREELATGAETSTDTEPDSEIESEIEPGIGSGTEPEAEPEASPRGLRKFDLGTVPASVTPPRTWRKAAWFAICTSAAVVCGLAVAAVQLVGAPTPDHSIDALPAYPTWRLEIEDLPARAPADPVAGSRRSDTPSSAQPTRTPLTGNTGGGPAPVVPTEPRTLEPTSDANTLTAGGGAAATAFGAAGAPSSPIRTTVGSVPVTPTDPKRMGDRTEQYFALVAEDVEAAYELCTGGMAREGPESIGARYDGVARVVVQDITIDRGQAITTSRVKVVHDDGTETLEKRQLTFTWGGDPKISGEVATG